MPATEGKLSQEELIKAIEGMSVLDLSELVKGLETRFGVRCRGAGRNGCTGRRWCGGCAGGRKERRLT